MNRICFERVARFWIAACVAAAPILGRPALAQEEPEKRQAPVALREGDTFYPVVRGRRGAVAGGNPFTVQAGFRILLAGGNAVDAGVAMVLAGAVTEFDSYGFGGEVPILVYAARARKVSAVNGVGFAPQAATPERFSAVDSIPGEGPLAAVVPSVLDNSVLALERFGSRSFCEVSAPARELAEGFPMPEGLARRIEAEAEKLRQWPASARVFLPGGRPPRAGEVFVQKDLAATLRALCAAEERALERAGGGAAAHPKGSAERGGVSAPARRAGLQAVRDEFYRGGVAREFARGARQAGGLLSEADLAAFEARLEEPVSLAYGEYTLYKPGYWTQGPALLHTLGLLSHFDVRALGHNSAAYVHVLTEAMKLAFADRDRWFGDPDFVRVPARGYMSAEYIRERARLIDRERASLERRPGDPFRYEDGSASAGVGGWEPAGAARRPGGSTPRDTTSMEAVDAEGNLFSATASGAWLPSVVAGATGIPMSTRLESFLLEPGHPNVLAPRKRPRITLTPTLVLRKGEPWMALSTVGGDYQDQVILQVFLNLALFGMSVQQAIEAPKFTTDHLVDSFAGHPFKAASLSLEERLHADGDLVRDLEGRGHRVASTGSWGNGTAPTAILFDARTGVIEAGADPRRHRQAIAW